MRVWLLNGWNTVQSFGACASRRIAFATKSIGESSNGISIASYGYLPIRSVDLSLPINVLVVKLI